MRKWKTEERRKDIEFEIRRAELKAEEKRRDAELEERSADRKLKELELELKKNEAAKQDSSVGKWGQVYCVAYVSPAVGPGKLCGR